jgi:hypothetical protein
VGVVLVEAHEDESLRSTASETFDGASDKPWWISAMTPDQIDSARKWLSRRSITCGCGSREFTLNHDLVKAPANTDVGVAMVMVIAVCENCARVHFYSADTMGIT